MPHGKTGPIVCFRTRCCKHRLADGTVPVRASTCEPDCASGDDETIPGQLHVSQVEIEATFVSAQDCRRRRLVGQATFVSPCVRDKRIVFVLSAQRLGSCVPPVS